MNANRIFGTDGIRGAAGEGWLTDAGASAIGRTLGRVLFPSALAAHGAMRTRVVTGHDGRASGLGLEAALARGLVSSGCAVESLGLVTTPGLAWLARHEGYALAVMLSASHNPASDNGIKVFGAGGEKLSDEQERAVEAALLADPSPIDQGPLPAARPDLQQAYLADLVRSAGALSLKGRHIVLDCAHGGGSRLAPALLERLGARLTSIAASPDGHNINHNCGATHTEGLQAAVLELGADLGIALDGDGDRCILVDERGQVVHGDAILTLCARDRAAGEGFEDPRIVATVMSNRGLHRALREVGLSVLTVDVGDRNVVEALRREGLWLGGEQSGHIVFGADHGFIGDGLYTALRVLQVQGRRRVALSVLALPFQAFPQVLVNVPVVRKPAWRDLPGVVEATERVERELAPDGRVLLRYSGTEPLARVMVEGPDEHRIRTLAGELAALIQVQIGR